MIERLEPILVISRIMKSNWSSSAIPIPKHVVMWEENLVNDCPTLMVNRVRSASTCHHSTVSCFQEAEAPSENKAAMMGGQREWDYREDPTRSTHPCINAERIVYLSSSEKIGHFDAETAV